MGKDRPWRQIIVPIFVVEILIEIMTWLNIILGALVALLAGINIYQLVNFRAYKKKYYAEAEKEEAEASESKQSALERRLGAMEVLYDEQGKVIDSLRKDILKLSSEKYANERRMVQLESENKALKEEVQT